MSSKGAERDRTLMPSRSKVAIVGAGIGGLAATLELAAGGFDVTLLERRSVPGGKIRQIDVDGAGIDSGPTVFTMRWVFEELFRTAGLDMDEHVTLSSSPVLARHSWPDGSRLDLYADVDASCEAITGFSSAAEANAYRRFAGLAKDRFETLDHSFMRSDKPSAVALSRSLGLRGLPRLYATNPFQTLWDELGQVFKDPRLRQLFGRYATYTGSSPFEAPATLALISHAERVGVWLVEGGMVRLPMAIADAALAAGATIHYETHVESVERNGRSFTLELSSGETIGADAVVYNGDVNAMSTGLLGEAVERALPDRRSENRSLSALTWSLCSDSVDFPLEHHTVFFGGDYPAEFRALRDNAIADEPTVYVCAQDRHGSAAPANGEAERLFLLVNAPPVRLRDEQIEQAQDSAMSLLRRQGFNVKLDADSVERRTPDDFERLFPGSDGAIYGWPTHGWSGSFRRSGAKTSVPGLFCAGGTVHPGPGIPMAAQSGRIAAAKVREFLS